MGVRFLLKGHCPGGTSLWSGDLGGHPPHGQGPEGVSDPGGETDDEMAPAEDNGREVEIHLGSGGGKGGGEIIDGGGVYQAAAEHVHTLH